MLATASAADPGDAYKGIWTEELPEQEQISKERFDLIIRYVAEGKPARQQQLRKLYEEDRSKFWSEVRTFFRENPLESPSPQEVQGRTSKWREDLLKQHEEFIGWLREAYPEKEKELAHLREKDLDEYFRRFGALHRKYANVAGTQKKNPELAGVLKEDLDLLDQHDALLLAIRQADNQSKPKLVKDLHEIVGKRFDLIVRKKQLQYDELRRRLDRLRRDLEKKEQELGKLIESKEEVTRHRVEELINPTPKIDWQ